MSSHSYLNPCPVCNNEMDCCTDNKPFDYVGGSCIYCGFSYYTKTEQMSLGQINELRKEHNDNSDTDNQLKPLTQKEYNKYKKEIKELY